MLTEVIQVYGRPFFKVEDSLGERMIYPPGTQRLVRQFNVFPKTLDGERRGWFARSLVLQELSLQTRVTPLSEFYTVHVWKDVMYERD